MAKDDYDVICYKVLLYLYAIFKRVDIWDDLKFKKAVANVSEDYLANILSMMTDEKLITGLVFQTVWGNDQLLVNDFSDMKITSNGIHYLQENSRMHKVKQYLLDHSDIISGLIKML